MTPAEQAVNVLKTSAPFESLANELLQRIAILGRPMRYRAGETIYEVDAAADDIYVVMEGEVEHAFDPGLAVATQLVKVVGPGNIFGWAALFKDPPGAAPRTRLAKTVSLRDTEVLAINAQALIDVLGQGPSGTREQVMARFASMVTRMYGFAGFVKIKGKLVPAHIATSDSAVPLEYDTFAF